MVVINVFKSIIDLHLEMGQSKYTLGHKNFFDNKYYSWHTRVDTYEDLRLGDRDYITGLKITQGEILDGVTFVTNLRGEVHFDRHGGSHHEFMILYPVINIIALNVNEFGVIERVGSYTVPCP